MTFYTDIYDLARFFSEMAKDVPYPTVRAKPAGGDFKTHKEWGDAMDKWEIEQADVRELRRQYSKTQGEINLKFKVALLDFLEIADHPKAELLWSMAWDTGHSDGMSEVAQVAERLSELLK